MPHVYLSAYGVKLDVEVQDESLMPKVAELLPPGWERSDEFPEDGHFTLSGPSGGGYSVLVDGMPISVDSPADVALHVLDSQVRGRVARLAQERIFVHAGVVAVGERALILPGRSFSGKTTLVAALVAEGALYYSDEFAVLDESGLVHPYPRRLSLRSDGTFREYADPAALGGRSGDVPARPSVIAITRWVAGGRWDPIRQGPGLGALALLTNAVPARPRTEATIQAVSRAVEAAMVLDGDRGEADETARLLLATLRETEDLRGSANSERLADA